MDLAMFSAISMLRMFILVVSCSTENSNGY